MHIFRLLLPGIYLSLCCKCGYSEWFQTWCLRCFGNLRMSVWTKAKELRNELIECSLSKDVHSGYLCHSYQYYYNYYINTLFNIKYDTVRYRIVRCSTIIVRVIGYKYGTINYVRFNNSQNYCIACLILNYLL